MQEQYGFHLQHHIHPLQLWGLLELCTSETELKELCHEIQPN